MSQESLKEEPPTPSTRFGARPGCLAAVVGAARARRAQEPCDHHVLRRGCAATSASVPPRTPSRCCAPPSTPSSSTCSTAAPSPPPPAPACQLAVRRYTAWLAEEDEIDADPFLCVKAPKLDVRVVEPLSGEQLRALLKACAGPDFRDRRDEAIVRIMIETGPRAGQMVSMCIQDLDLAGGRAVVVRRKCGKGRVIPFSPQAPQG